MEPDSTSATIPLEAIEPAKSSVSTESAAVPNKDVGLAYWQSCDSDENSMLGGLPTLEGYSIMSRVDLQSSRNFLAKLGIGVKPGLRIVDAAIEGGAG